MDVKVSKHGHVAIERVTLILVLMACPENAANREAPVLKEIIEDFNQDFHIELNLLIQLKQSTPPSPEELQFNELFAECKYPKLIVSQDDIALRVLYQHFNMQVLTIARVSVMTQNRTLNIMEHLLWKRHFTNIIVQFDSEDWQNAEHQLLDFFREAWNRGFTSLLVLWHNTTYTYNPFGAIEVMTLPHYSHFKNKTFLQNFRLERFQVMDMDYPPRSFSYHNRQGQLIRTGYYYKIVENFIKHFNGSIQNHFVDIWKEIDWRDLENYDFVTNQIPPMEGILNSDTFYYTNYRLMVPSAKEIDQSLYLLVSFDGIMWLIILITILLTFMLIYAMPHDRDRCHRRRDMSRSLLQSLSVIISMPINWLVCRQRPPLHFVLCLLFLFTGFSFTNLYICNLSSIYTSRLHEPQLHQIEDIARTDLKIILHTAEIKMILAIENLPPIFYERCTSGNDAALHQNRMKLHMNHIYAARDDLLNMLLYQQRYLKIPRAKTIAESVLASHLSLMIPYRSKIIEQLNRYLSHIKDSGLLQKFMADSEWDSFLSGVIQFFRDDELEMSLSMVYFRYAFIVWCVGLLCASIVFVSEIYWWKNENEII